MAIPHGPAIRDVVCNNVVDAIDVGGAGKFIFQTAASVAAATLTMSATAFGAAASGSATPNPIASDTNAAGTGAGTTTGPSSTVDGDADYRGLGPNVGLGYQPPSTNIEVGDTVSVSS